MQKNDSIIKKVVVNSRKRSLALSKLQAAADAAAAATPQGFLFTGDDAMPSEIFPCTLLTPGHLCPRHDAPGADDVVSVASEEGLAIGGPGQADTLGLAALLADGGELGLELINLALLLEVEDDDAAGGSSAEPVAVGGEDESVDLVVGVEGVEVLGLVKIPEHGGAVLATRGAERAIGRDGDGVDVAGVADVVGLQLAGRKLPNLFFLESARGSYDRIAAVAK